MKSLDYLNKLYNNILILILVYYFLYYYIMNHSIELEYGDFNNKNSITNYIPLHYVQFFLLLSVPIIIYIVDHISNINNIIFSMPLPIPGTAPSSQSLGQQKPPQIQFKNKKNKSYKKLNFKK